MKYQKMKMRNSVLIVFSALLSVLILGALYMDSQGYFNPPAGLITSDTVTVHDTVWRDTTVVEREFMPRYVEKVRVDTVYSGKGDTIELVTEAKAFEKRLVSGRDTCDLEIHTSGINTSLDSLKMRLRTHSVTHTVEITNTVRERKTFLKRFHIGIQAGYGYGFQYHGLEPYVGIGGSFDL